MRKTKSLLILMAGIFGAAPSVPALDLDWSGQFRSEAHWLWNYSLDPTNTVKDATRANAEGYYIPGGGDTHANFQSFFLKLRPGVVVNDNIYIKSEWWVGDPVYGFFGGSTPYSVDQRMFYSSQSRGSLIGVQRLWGEFLSDAGVIQVGRAPLHWGLGVVWNSGNDVWSRYSSTGDLVRLVSKFGSFSFVPSIVVYGLGNNLGGACPDATSIGADGTCSVTLGNGRVTDYSIGIKYDNPDEDIELGVNYIRRIGGAAAQIQGFDGATGGVNLNIWDIFGKKKLGPVTLALEAPIITGEVGSVSYATFGLAFEGHWQIAPAWDLSLMAGRATGQPSTNGTPTSFSGFYFNPNYKLGMIMFNYQLANFAGPNVINQSDASASNLLSPFDNPISNAQYYSLGGSFRTGRWQVRTGFILAHALETANSSLNTFYNVWKRKFVTHQGGGNQDPMMGWEVDLGTTFHWDEMFQFMVDLGVFFPGGFYQFSNTGTANTTAPVFGIAGKVGVVF